MPANLQMGFKNVRKNIYTGSIQMHSKLPIVGEKQPSRLIIKNTGKILPVIKNTGKILPVIRSNGGGGGGGCGCGGR